MASGGHKRKRLSHDALQRMVHTGGISVVGLAALFKKIKAENVADVPDTTRSDMRAARQLLYDEVRLEFDLHLANGGNFRWELLCPLKLLAKAIQLSPDFRKLFGAAVRRSPPSAQHPWRLAIGYDGFTPGGSSNVACLLW